MTEENKEYEAFVDKFKPKKTTDDCYTPALVYDAVAKWVEGRYGVKQDNMIRPFYPGGDYKKEIYGANSVVVDNPPFSILGEIVRFYMHEGVKFFLFAPSQTLFSSTSEATAIPVGVSITYENGAKVNTSFVTNLEDPDVRVKTEPTLYSALEKANNKEQRKDKIELPKYVYPNEVITSSMACKWCKYGVEYSLRKSESVKIAKLDAQKENGKTIFGSGYLISEKAAAEKAAAEKAAAEKAAAIRWKLSDREEGIVKGLNGKIMQ